MAQRSNLLRRNWRNREWVGPAVPFNRHQPGSLNGSRQLCLFCVVNRDNIPQTCWVKTLRLLCLTGLKAGEPESKCPQVLLLLKLWVTALCLSSIWLWLPQVCGCPSPVSWVLDLLGRHLPSGADSSSTTQNDLISRSLAPAETFSPNMATFPGSEVGTFESHPSTQLPWNM